MSPLCRCCKTFLVKPHSPPDGFYWDHQCSWTLTSANSMRVYIMQTDDCYRKWQGLRQGLNQLCQRYLEWMGEQLGANISFLVSGFAWRKTCKMFFVEEILISPNLSTEKYIALMTLPGQNYSNTFLFLSKNYALKLSITWATNIAPRYRLCLPSCGCGFQSQAHHLRFFNLYNWNCNEKRTKINEKEAGIGPFLKKNCLSPFERTILIVSA